MPARLTWEERIVGLGDALRSSQVVYFGTRGTDAESLALLGSRFVGVFSQIAPLGSGLVPEVCLETLSAGAGTGGSRVDLDTYDIDRDGGPVAAEFRKRLEDACVSRRVAIVPYRSTALLEFLALGHATSCRVLGNYTMVQKGFENKPWVEATLRRADVRCVGQEYHPLGYGWDLTAARLKRLLHRGPIVVRNNVSDGGTGLHLVREEADLERIRFRDGDLYFASSVLLEGAVPLNVNAVVFRDGAVRLHPASLQIIGHPFCTDRAFGYCGNDFAAVKALDPSLLDNLEQAVARTGRLLARYGYVGAFGLDALVSRRYDGKEELLVSEVNPRFQGSSVHAARLMTELGHPDQFMDHMAAHLGLQPGSSPSLREITGEQRPLAHVVVHNLAGGQVSLRRPWNPKGGRVEARCVPGPGVRVAPGATLADIVFSKGVTRDGYRLLSEAEVACEYLRSLFELE